MNIVELWTGLKGGPLREIIELLKRIEANQHRYALQASIRFDKIDAALADIKAQLDRIEADIGGGNQAASLLISVGSPTEQE